MRSDGFFYGTFTNAVGTKIDLSNSNIEISSSDGVKCFGVVDNPIVLGGHYLKVTAIDCTKGQPLSDTYKLKVKIPYSYTVSGEKRELSDEGVITGTFEESTPYFSKIKPQLGETSMSTDGVFHGVFTSGVGTPINVRLSAVKIRSAGGVTCTASGGYVNVDAGDNFDVDVSGCPSGLLGESYTVTVEIPYTINLDGENAVYKETGTIKGSYE